MPKFFICYRREDSKWPAQWIYNNLADHFGSESVVFDVDTIPLGIDFREYLNKQVSKCDILLAVIGDQWTELLKSRIDEPKDFVRIEIQVALEREIPVVPILVGGASVPHEKNLPPELAGLAYRNAAEVRAGPDLQTHLKRLISGLDRLTAERKFEEERKQKEEQKREKIPKAYTNNIGMNFVLIPAGNFMMGNHISPEEAVRRYGGEAKSYKREHPQHDVKISDPFYLQTTAVTVGQWRKFIQKTGYKTEAETGGGAYFLEHILDSSYWRKEKGVYWDNPGFPQDDRQPATCLSWNDVQEFIRWLNRKKVRWLNRKKGNDKHRLPTEAEWEYANRAGNPKVYSYGDDAAKLGEYAWYSDNSEGKAHPVGQKIPNSWGIYDMHGNVWEWVEDDFHDTYDGAPSDGSAWINQPRGAGRVLRGGNWYIDAQDCRAAFRNESPPGVRASFIGFRLAMSIALGTYLGPRRSVVLVNFR